MHRFLEETGASGDFGDYVEKVVSKVFQQEEQDNTE